MPEREAAAVAAAVQEYMDGMAIGDAERLREVLHPGFSCIGHFGGGLE